MVVAIVPAFATDATSSGNNKTTLNLNKTHKNATNLTNTQLAKLNLTQTKLNNLIAKIDNLTATYKNNTKAKGLLVALAQYKKQAVKLNKQINYFKAHPPKSHGKVLSKKANVVIKKFAFKQYILNKKVALKAKLLAKLSN
jgi:hypothetical protein